MKLIVGGAYQGKSAYAAKHFPGMRVLPAFHMQVLEMVKQGIDPAAQVQTNLADYADCVILCDDISCGVVPTDPVLRAWREGLGRTLAVIATSSDEVVRLFCGIGTRVK